MIISVTELRLRNIWQFPLFIRHSVASTVQAQQSPGVVSVKSKIGWQAGYTITVWKDKESMMAFRNSGAHKEAMKDIKRVSNKYKTLHYESDDIPNWTQARQRLAEMDYRVL